MTRDAAERLDYWNWYAVNAGPDWPDPSEPLAELSGADVFFWPTDGESEDKVRTYLDEWSKELDFDDFVAGKYNAEGTVVVTQFWSERTSDGIPLRLFELNALASDRSKIPSGKAARSFGELFGKLVQ